MKIEELFQVKCPHGMRPVWLLLFLTRVLSYFQEFACNGVVIEHPEYGEVLQLQGDQWTKVCAWLSNPKIGLVRADQLKVHGF